MKLQLRTGGLALSRVGAIAIIWLNRPEKLNALAGEFWLGLRILLDELRTDAACRVILLTGKGERAFSAGGDIASFDALADDEARHAFQINCMATFTAIERCPLPIIAAVNGMAVGGGCELAMACDIVIAAQSATFSMPEANLGLVPGYGILRAPALVGRQWTNWLVMSCEQLDATAAAAIGLVQRVLPDESFLKEAMAIAGRIAKRSPEGLAAAKALTSDWTNAERIDASVAALTRLHASRDGAEGRLAFRERRPPRFGCSAKPLSDESHSGKRNK
jgi:enoyl-CoA hydratase